MRPLPVLSLCLLMLGGCAAYTSENWPDLGEGFERRSAQSDAPGAESGEEGDAVLAPMAEQPSGAVNLPASAGALGDRLESTLARIQETLDGLQDALARLEADAASNRARLDAELHLSRLEAGLADVRAIARQAEDNDQQAMASAARTEAERLATAIQSARRRLSGSG